jgi:predicted phosphodiesterase
MSHVAKVRRRSFGVIRGTLARSQARASSNHDRWALNDDVDVSGWDLSPESIAYLASAPTYWRKLIDGARVVLTHARPESDMKGIVEGTSDQELKAILAAADVLIVGHTHVPFVRRLAGNKLVANPGALLRDAPDVEVATPGTFGVFDGAASTFVVMRAADGSIVLRS